MHFFSSFSSLHPTLHGSAKKISLDAETHGKLKMLRRSYGRIAAFQSTKGGGLCSPIRSRKKTCPYLEHGDGGDEDWPDAEQVDGDVDGLVVIRRIKSELLLEVELVQETHGDAFLLL